MRRPCRESFLVVATRGSFHDRRRTSTGSMALDTITPGGLFTRLPVSTLKP
jgi:hypothetical protein